MFRGRAFSLVLLVVALLGTASLAFYFSPPVAGPKYTTTTTTATTCAAERRGGAGGEEMTRRTWIPQIAFSLLTPLVLTTGATGAFAADPARLGTKDDPAFQKCMASCIYFCLKPKGTETRTRSDCLPECKEQCAKTDQQKMLGVPKK